MTLEDALDAQGDRPRDQQRQLLPLVASQRADEHQLQPPRRRTNITGAMSTIDRNGSMPQPR